MMWAALVRWAALAVACAALVVEAPGAYCRPCAPREAATAATGVTVLSGFLGTGKTTLLRNLLQNSDGLRLGVIVNDVAALNIDLDVISALGGATGGALLIYTAPALMALRLRSGAGGATPTAQGGGGAGVCERAGLWALALLGVVLAYIGTLESLRTL